MDKRVALTVNRLEQKRDGVSRRDFMRAMGVIAAALSIPLDTLYAAFTQSLAKVPKLPVIWLEFQDCTGCTESLLRAGEAANLGDTSITDPSIIDLLLDVISVEYHETIMAPSGDAADKSRRDVMAAFPGQYVVIVEGSIPTAANGAYCCIGGRSAVDLLTEVCTSARATIALGSCASSGGLAAAAPNPTSAKGVAGILPNLTNLVNIPGCPVNVVNLVSTICYFIAYNQLPPLDNTKEPRFLSNGSIHGNCIRRGVQTATSFDDVKYRTTYACLKNIGCKGLGTAANCSQTTGLANGSWNGCNAYCTKAGHGCISCVTPGFWDTTFPLYPVR